MIQYMHMENKQKITKNMTVTEVIEKHPEVAPTLMEFDLHCFGCPMAPSETVEELAENHQIDLNKLLTSLNKAAK